MQTQSRFFDDLARVANGALSAAAGMRAEIEQLVRQQFDRFLADRNLVTREDFEAVEAMAAKAREEQEKLAARVTELEAALAAKARKPAPAAAKPSAPRRRAGPPLSRRPIRASSAASVAARRATAVAPVPRGRPRSRRGSAPSSCHRGPCRSGASGRGSSRPGLDGSWRRPPVRPRAGPARRIGGSEARGRTAPSKTLARRPSARPSRHGCAPSRPRAGFAARFRS